MSQAAPLPAATRVPPTAQLRSYTVRAGDTLSGIAAGANLTVEELMAANGLSNPNQLAVGQALLLPVPESQTGPAQWLLPDSELVYSPAYAAFDVAAALAAHGGYLATYSELFNGKSLSAAEVVELAALEYSVGPRVLLTLLEMQGGWLTKPTPDAATLEYPLGWARAGAEGLYKQLAWAADGLNAGFYGWYDDRLWTFRLQDGAYIQFAPALNAGTAGIQRMLALNAADYAAWVAQVEHFDATYHRLWGDPAAYAVDLFTTVTAAPELVLPWPQGETWYYTGGPHGGWGDGSSWAALDFVTGEQNLGCYTSSLWATAAASGPVIFSDAGMVLQDLDGDGDVTTGWVLLYMHLAEAGRVSVGTSLQVGDRVGHPSCEGGFSNASHLHLARRHNGVWIAAAHPQWPLALSGWIAGAGVQPYDGSLARNGTVKTAEEVWADVNAITH